MKHLALFVVAHLLLGCAQDELNKVKISLSPPATLQAQDEVYLVGNVNDWQLEGERAVKLNRVGDQLVADITTEKEQLFFTFVKNKDWRHAPASKTGNGLCTFHLNVKADKDPFLFEVPAWKTDTPTMTARDTLTGQIDVIANFEMSELQREGDILVYLPPNYSISDSAHFPVMYMLDGQNVFNRKTAYSDEWQIDESMEKLIANKAVKDTIIVAIPNGPKRWHEYNPWPYLDQKGELQQGKGHDTLNFIKNNLKPFIDGKFRTKKDRKNTGLAGSSLGGLMALYAALEHSDTFGFVGAFSPSLGVVNAHNEGVLAAALKQHQTIETRVYVDMGKLEYDGYQEFDELIFHLRDKGLDSEQLMVVKDDIGRHCELDWSKRFPDAMKWLLPNS